MSTTDVFSLEPNGNVLIATPQGDLFQYRYNDLRDGYNLIFRTLDDPGILHLAIDFGNVGHFGSTFIGMLIKLAQKVRRGGGEAVLCGMTAEMQEVFGSLMLLENVKTDFFWVPYPDRETALAALSEVPPPADG